MIVLVQVIIYLCYVINPFIAFALSLVQYIYIFTLKKYDFYYKLLISLIVSAPLYQVSIIGGRLHHFFSWYNIFLIIYISYLLSANLKNMKVNNKILISIIVMFFVICFKNFFITIATFETMYKFIEFSMIIISILLTYLNRDSLYKKIAFAKERFLDIAQATIISIAVLVIIQYLTYSVFHIVIGQITFFPSRTVYDAFFKAYSIFSLFIGIGIVICYINFLKGKRIKNIIFILLYITALIINTSRTGLISAIFVCIIITCSNRKYMNKKLIVTLIAGIISISIISSVFLMNNRASSETFISDNGRLDTYYNALERSFSSAGDLLLGIGLDKDTYTEILPHNMIFETLLTNGIIVLVVILTYIFKFLRQPIINDYKYIAIYIFIGFMFITGFFETTFIAIYLILAANHIDSVWKLNIKKELGEYCE